MSDLQFNVLVTAGLHSSPNDGLIGVELEIQSLETRESGLIQFRWCP